MGEIGELAGRTVIVTGAAGFLGRAIRPALIRAGARVIAVDRNARCDDASHEWRRLACGRALLSSRPFEADTLIHLAWNNAPDRGDRDLAGDVERNVRASLRVFEEAVASGVRRIIYPSSGGTIYGVADLPTPETAPVQPLGGYGAGKAAIELFLRAMNHTHGVNACILRLANPYGPGQLAERGQGFIATVARRVLAGEPVQLFGDGRAIRDFVYVDDVAQAFVKASARSAGYEVYNIGGGRPSSINEILGHIFATAGRRSPITVQPPRPSDLDRSGLDISKAARGLDWTPVTSFETGLRATLAWQGSQLQTRTQAALQAWPGAVVAGDMLRQPTLN